MKKAVSYILLITLIITLIPSIPAYAANDNNIVDVSKATSQITITSSGGFMTASTGGATIMATGTGLVITGSTNQSYIVVSGPGVFALTLSGAAIDKSGAHNIAALSSTNSAVLNINLHPGTVNSLTSGAIRAGLETGERGVTITSIATATLSAIGDGAAAGIGGERPDDDGNGGAGSHINILGSANVMATGGANAAGIGGGGGPCGAGSNINISGSANVTATGGGCAAGIGGGLYGEGRDINIYGLATVKASADPNVPDGMAAGIGGGQFGAGSNINISGSAKVTATGASNAAGIGGGQNGAGSDISIFGSAEVTATALDYGGSGIGGGLNCAGSDINISGSAKVTANGARHGAGIGGGVEASGSSIKIFGSATVNANGGEEAAGIGGGFKGTGSGIYISESATVKATAHLAAGAGIGGGGSGGAGSNINISGSANVTANGANYGAGIGGGQSGVGSNIKIFGSATVNANGGDEAAGIGGGENGEGKDISISGSAMVSASSLTSGAGIGGGYSKPGTNINIFGTSTVVARGGKAGSGIGGGAYGVGSYINIFDNADVDARGGELGAGIGGGEAFNVVGSSGRYITITGSATVLAKGDKATGIGGGHSGGGSNITISGLTSVTAIGGDEAAGIGGAYNNSGSNINISGFAKVTALAGEKAAGIGGGICGSGNSIIIKDNAVVYAKGGSSKIIGSDYYGAGAGIGGGGGSFDNFQNLGKTPGTVKDIKIEGGFVTAIAGESNPTSSFKKTFDIGAGGSAITQSAVTSEGIYIVGGSVYTPGRDTVFGTTPKGINDDDVHKVTVSAVRNTDGASLRGNLEISVPLDGGKIYKAKTVTSGAVSALEHGATFPADASAYIYLPEATYGGVTVGAFGDAVIDVVPISLTSGDQNTVKWTFVKQLTLTASPTSIKVSKESNLTVTADTAYSAVKFVIEGDPSVATLTSITSDSAVLKGLAKGNVTVRAISIYDPRISSTAIVTVTPRPPQPPNTIDVGDIDVEYVIEDDKILITPTEGQLNDLLNQAEPGEVIVIDVGGAGIPGHEGGFTGGGIVVDPGWVSEEDAGKTIVIDLGNGVNISIEADMLLAMNESEDVADGEVEILIESIIVDGKVVGAKVSFIQNGQEIDWYNYHYPVLITVTSGNESDSICSSVPRSLKGAGFVSIKIYTGGEYLLASGNAQGFTDMSKYKWAVEAVNAMSVRSVVNGKNSSEFDPSGDTTRSEFATMLIRFLAIRSDKIIPVEGTADIKFNDDAKIESWAKTLVYDAVKLGIIQGDSKGNFNPQDKITRQDMFVMIHRAMSELKMLPQDASWDANGEARITSAKSAFTDFGDVTLYAKQPIADLHTLKLANGKSGKIMPKAYTTRAETAQVIFNLLKYDFS